MTNEISKEWLKAYCKEHGYYNTPSLNDKLFLHFKVLDRIQNLEAGLRQGFASSLSESAELKLAAASLKSIQLLVTTQFLPF